MKLKMYGIYDDKAITFGHPFFQPREEMAIRMMHSLVNDQDTQHAKHPKDFSLYELGEYDTDTGIVTSEPPPHLVCTGMSLLNPPDSQVEMLLPDAKIKSI